MTEKLDWPWRVIDSPVRYMRARVDASPQLAWALLPVAINALLVGGAGIVTSARFVAAANSIDGVVAPSPPMYVLLPLSVVFGLIGFAAHVGAVVALDAVTTQSGLRGRLVELSGLAYWSQVLWSAPALLVMWLYLDPEAFVLPSNMDVMTPAMAYREIVGPEPLQIVMARTQQFAGIWLVGLHATVLKVVSGFTTGGTWAAGFAMGGVFLGIPAVLQAVVQRLLF